MPPPPKTHTITGYTGIQKPQHLTHSSEKRRNAFLEDINKKEAVVDYIREHQGATSNEVSEALGVSNRFLRKMAKKGLFFGEDNRKTKYPCANCGTLITKGVYCNDCLVYLRHEVKKRSEHLMNLKTHRMEQDNEKKKKNVILIIDSDELNSSMAKVVLEKGVPGCEILTADNFVSAIKIMHINNVVQVILDDAATPNYSGLAILKHIREDALLKDTPVIMMTSLARKEIMTPIIAYDVEDYVIKPFNPRDLVERVSSKLSEEILQGEVGDFSSRTTYKILLIDDNILDVRQERETLEKNFPCDVTVTQSGVEGLYFLNDNRVDLVIVSFEMPFMDGLEILQFIRNDEKLRSLPVIMMTDSTDFALLENIKQSSARGYIRKPNISSDGIELIKRTLRYR